MANYHAKRLRLLKMPDSDSCGLTAFGCLWTAMCAVIFPVAFSNGDPPTVLYVFAVIFPTIGVLMLAPGCVAFLSRPRYEVSVPEVRVSGSDSKEGNRLLVEIQQKSRSRESLRNVTIFIELCQRRREGPHGSRSGSAPLTVYFGELFSSDWERGWADCHTERIGFVAAREHMNVKHDFTIPEHLRGKQNQQVWWGIDVVTAADGRELFAGTFWLEQPV